MGEETPPTRREVLAKVDAKTRSGRDRPSEVATEASKRYNVGIAPDAPRNEVEVVVDRAETVEREIDLGGRRSVVSGRFNTETRRSLRSRRYVEYVERDAVLEASAQTVPWGVDRIDADVTIADGVTGDGARVAILDTGIDDDHPDLPRPVLGRCFGTCCGNAGCSNGNACNEPWSDDDDHGTAVAGTVAALDNARGVVGVGPDIELMAGKVLDGCGNGFTSDIADGIRWATDNGANVVNMSLGGGTGTQTLKNACQYAYDRGVVLVAAAGNDGPCADCVGYPAKYGTVVAVSATTQNDRLSGFSSTGPEVELAAPGQSTKTVVPGRVSAYSGTSIACPHVAAVAALVANQDGVSGPQTVRDRLTSTAEDVGLGTTEQGNGLVDVERAVPKNLTEDWRADTGARYQYAAPALGTSRVFLAAVDGTLAGLNRDDGTVDWQLDREGALVDSSPTLSNGRVFVGSGGGRVYAVDADSGTVGWSVDTDSALVSSPTVDDGRVYVGSNDGTVFAFDEGDGSELWQTEVGAPVYSTPATDGTGVFVTTDAGETVALSASTGAELWREGAFFGFGHASPTVADGRVYVAGADVVAFDPTTGAESWRYGAFGDTAGSSPAYDAVTGGVYVGDAAGVVHALDATDGTADWTTIVGGAVGSTPAVVSGSVVVGTDDGLSVLDAATGGQTASAALGRLRSRPAVDDGASGGGVAFVTTWSGVAYGLSNVP